MSITPQATKMRVEPRVCAGVDWAKDDHAIAIIGPDGEVTDRFAVDHDAAGLKAMVWRLLKAGVDEVGIERGDGPVVEALLQAGLVVLVIPPGQLKNLRSRYGSAGTKDDRYDAYILADVVRTDRRRLRPLVRDSAATTALRSSVRARRDLVEHRVGTANQLRAHLQTVFPAAAGIFAAIDSQISLTFLERFTTQAKADWLSPKRLAAWLSSIGYSGHTSPEALHARLLAAPRGTTGPEAETVAVTTLAFVAILGALSTQVEILAGSIGEQLTIHPDAHIYTNLPRVKALRASRLLAEIGDARGRFPTADSLACLAGVAPPTRQSGKVKAVTFRWGANKELKDAVCDFAGGSRHDNPWTADLYARARARGHDHPHAVRILGRAWIHIIWRRWQDNAQYDPTKHRALQTLLKTTADKAA